MYVFSLQWTKIGHEGSKALSDLLVEKDRRESHREAQVLRVQRMQRRRELALLQVQEQYQSQQSQGDISTSTVDIDSNNESCESKRSAIDSDTIKSWSISLGSSASSTPEREDGVSAYSRGSCFSRNNHSKNSGDEQPTRELFRIDEQLLPNEEIAEDELCTIPLPKEARLRLL
jgi:hypothetical protein